MADQGRSDVCVVFTMSLCALEFKQTIMSLLFQVIRLSKLSKQALKSYLMITCEFLFHILRNKEVSAVVVKTTWNSDLAAIFSVIVYCFRYASHWNARIWPAVYCLTQNTFWMRPRQSNIRFVSLGKLIWCWTRLNSASALFYCWFYGSSLEGFLLLFLFSDWEPSNYIKSWIKRGFLDIFLATFVAPQYKQCEWQI